MTFKEKLTSISDELELELSMAKYCAAIRDKMAEAAQSGYRTFQIEIARHIGGGSTFIAEPDAKNCYTIMSTYKPDKMAVILNKVKDYLYQLGFSPNDIEQTSIRNNTYQAVVLKLWW